MMDDDFEPPKILLRHKIVGAFWMIVAWAVMAGVLYFAATAINQVTGVRLDQWNELTIGAFAGVGVWAIVYLLDKVRKLEQQIKALKREDERLNESIEVLYIVHNKATD